MAEKSAACTALYDEFSTNKTQNLIKISTRFSRNLEPLQRNFFENPSQRTTNAKIFRPPSDK